MRTIETTEAAEVACGGGVKPLHIDAAAPVVLLYRLSSSHRLEKIIVLTSQNNQPPICAVNIARAATGQLWSR